MSDRKKTILIVDDEPQMRALLSTYLQRRGFHTEEAPDGEAALESVRRLKPDLMILDIEMPKRNGFDVLQCLRSDPTHSGIRVIVLTARSGPRYLEKGVALQTDFYLPKPVDLDNLTDFIHVVLTEP